MRQSLVSIHDVMPPTLDRVERLLELARQCEVSKFTLLVVPGVPWTEAEVDRVRCWQDGGCALAGHGWTHHAERIRGWGHRLHSWVISRDVAEHLAIDPEARLELMQRCVAWFEDNGFEIPLLYVPPAWALGRLPANAAERVPFRLVETLTGIYCPQSGARYRLPLVGFEADNRLRAAGLSASNAANAALASLLRRPVRVAIHPRDLELRLASNLLRTLEREMQCIDYVELALSLCPGMPTGDNANKPDGCEHKRSGTGESWR